MNVSTITLPDRSIVTVTDYGERGYTALWSESERRLPVVGIGKDRHLALEDLARCTLPVPVKKTIAYMAREAA